MPSESINRHPFPVPGLGIRVLEEVTKDKVRILQEADDIFIEELIENDLYDKVSQAFVALFPVKSVGIMGDKRTYEYIASVRAVITEDFMTATWAHLPYEFLEKVSGNNTSKYIKINCSQFLTSSVEYIFCMFL